MKAIQIDTRQGTANSATYSNGNTLPYTGVPWGMNYFVTQTTNEKGSWFFHPQDHTFQGFRLTHQPSPWMGDFSQLLLTPLTGEIQQHTLYGIQSSYRPEEAVFNPHYLKIKQLRYQITSELVPSTYGAKLKIHYAKNDLHSLLFSAPAESAIAVDFDTNIVTGYVKNFADCVDKNFKMYFAFTADQIFSPAETGFFEGEIRKAADHNQADDQLFQLAFREFSSGTAVVTIATSFISPEQAQLNLQRELTDDFYTTKEKAETAWNDYLGKINITDRDSKKVSTFYHCLYRTGLFPQRFYEYDALKQPIHYNTTAKRVEKGILYTNNGFWDTYKTVFPLYSLLVPELYAEMLEGFLNSYRESGYLPKWLSPDERGMMPGTLIDAVIADAAVKNIGAELMPDFLKAMEYTASTPSANGNYGRQGGKDYERLGYVPLSYHESVNHTLDYAYSDFCISVVAGYLGLPDKAKKYRDRSRNYQQLFSKADGFMRAKDENGQFRTPFNPFAWGGDYAEGSAWQSSFAVFHDFAGLIEQFGGENAFLARLTELANTPPTFDVTGYPYEIHEMSEMAMIDFGQIALSNQPSFHIPYLFTYAKRPDLTQLLVKQACSRFFDDSFTGFPGDEDNGSMAGWYVWSTLGLYPVTPGSGEYVLGIPAFDEVVITLPTGKIVRISSHNNTVQHQFVAGLKWNGEVFKKLAISHQELVCGAELEFELGLVPPLGVYGTAIPPFSI